MARRSASTSKPPGPVAPTTQRAYTLRLRRAPGKCPHCEQDACDCWREALWATHAAFNRGAKAFGDWLLTLRGGLSHELAEQPSPPKNKEPTCEESDAIRKNRRILLALSWLSVEDDCSAPTGTFRVASGKDSEAERKNKVLTAFRSILTARRMRSQDVESWIADCAASLSAKIREDAVWINRSACFDQRALDLKVLSREYAKAAVMSFFGPLDEYFKLPDEADDTKPAVGGDGPDFRTLARQWVSTNFGTGKKSDSEAIAQNLRKLADANLAPFSGKPKAALIAHLSVELDGSTADIDGLCRAIGWNTGRPSKGRVAIERLPDPPTETSIQTMQQKFREEAEAKASSKGLRQVPEWMPAFQKSIERDCGMPFKLGEGRDHIGEFSVMLDHAARRVSIGHSWIKRAEAERRRFEADAQRLNHIPAAAKDWLDQFVQFRSGSSGAAAAGGEYRIRRRAIEGWDEIIKRWKRAACKSPEDRVAAAREVQADPEIEKFGDIQLFEALAADDAECVWRGDGNGTPDPLKDYVAATDALDKMRRFKVPAYRHPDPLAHPVFGDFGNSRGDIRFAVHEAAKATRGTKRIAKDQKEWIRERHGLRMGLWDGQSVRTADLRWSSKRLVDDLALRNHVTTRRTGPVSRADRLGRAAAGLGADEAACVAGLFELPDWNGRLQAPRAQLDAIAACVAANGGKWDDKARKLRDRIEWLVSFSAKLECCGPFMEYASQNGIQPNGKGEYYPHAERNKGRTGHAKLILSRLPGLRVLAVDLGHRFAAACAVWEALSKIAFDAETKGREVVSGGRAADDLYCHTRHLDCAGKARTTIYRRIGPDKLPDGSDHPAPWARLDRQFLIKLQGEERPARAAGPAETAAVQQIETDLGRARGQEDLPPRPVDSLMREAVRTIRIALRRHGDAARIAYAFKPGAKRLKPGGGAQDHTPETHADAILEALLRWHELATGARWRDPWAETQWKDWVQPHISATLPELANDADRWERKRHRAALEQVLRPVAQMLIQRPTDALHQVWSKHWADEDLKWPSRLRWLRNWLLPRGPRARSGAARNVGGLSLLRIATLRELYQTQKAYAMRPEPDDPRKRIAGRNDDRYDELGRSVLQVIERLREQRVKQLASRIVEAALGVGRAKPTRGRQRPQSRVDVPCHAVIIESLRNYRPDELQTRRENRAIMNWSAGKVRKYLEEACQLHGLHLREVMPNYTSREDSRTGLPGVRCVDVPVDPKLGKPKAYWWNSVLSTARKKSIGDAASHDKQGDATSRFIVELAGCLDRLKADGKPLPKTVRVPRIGGDLFVAAPPTSCTAPAHQPHPACDGARALQADLNAAANIGLRALLDPDFPAKWWYVPCIDDQRGLALPRADKVLGSACFPGDPATFGSLLKTRTAAGPAVDGQAAPDRKPRTGTHRPGSAKSRSLGDGKATTNYWSDRSARDLRPADEGGHWQPTNVYWNWVRKRALLGLYSFNGLSPPSDDRP